MLYVSVSQNVFINKQNIFWNEVEQYLKIHRKIIRSKRLWDMIYIAGEFSDEFTEFQYTKSKFKRG